MTKAARSVARKMAASGDGGDDDKNRPGPLLARQEEGEGELMEPKEIKPAGPKKALPAEAAEKPDHP